MLKIVGWLINRLPFNGAKTYIGILGTGLSWIVATLVPWIHAHSPELAAVLPAALVQVIVHVADFAAKAFAFLAALGLVHKLDKGTAVLQGDRVAVPVVEDRPAPKVPPPSSPRPPPSPLLNHQ